MSDEWNIFGGPSPDELQHELGLGEPIKEEAVCDCGDLVKSHDRSGCMRKGCGCKVTLHTLTFNKEIKK